DAVLATLTSRHRTLSARRAALRIAARHVLPGGDRAMMRLARLRPDLASCADGLAAWVRQADVDRITDAVARRAPVVSERPFEALRELLVKCTGIETLLGDHKVVRDIGAWNPGPWELAWRRRHDDPELRSALFDRAAETPHVVTRAMDQLALLGDLERLD